MALFLIIVLLSQYAHFTLKPSQLLLPVWPLQQRQHCLITVASANRSADKAQIFRSDKNQIEAQIGEPWEINQMKAALISKCFLLLSDHAKVLSWLCWYKKYLTVRIIQPIVQRGNSCRQSSMIMFLSEVNNSDFYRLARFHGFAVRLTKIPRQNYVVKNNMRKVPLFPAWIPALYYVYIIKNNFFQQLPSFQYHYNTPIKGWQVSVCLDTSSSQPICGLYVYKLSY